MSRVAQDDLRHLRDREDVVHYPGCDGTARHAIVLGAAGVLHDRQAAAGVDGPEALRAVRAGPGEDDADGTLVLLVRQGLEQRVHWEAQAAGLDRRDPEQ